MKLKYLALSLGLLAAGTAERSAAGGQKDIAGVIDGALARVAGIEQMQPDNAYTVTVAGAKETGPKEFFIGQRTGAEVLESRSASGCSDYAAAFYKLMQDAGLQPVFIFGTQMSFGGLLDNFADHTGVAVKNGAKWVLVDPTRGIVVSEDWDYSSRVYEDEYYIGYKGPLESFGYRGPVGDRELNRLTALRMPPRLLNARIPFLDVYADDTMKNPEGKENIQVRIFRETLAGFYKSHNLEPAQKVKLRLTRDPGPYNSAANCYVKECVLSLGEKTAGSLGSLTWAMENIAALNNLRERAGRLARFEFAVDASLKNADGTYLNPNLGEFLKEAGDLYDALGIDEGRAVKVLIVNGGSDAYSDLSYEPARGWVFLVSTGSAMSLDLQRYLQDAYERAKPAEKKS